jgi:electron transfer flavoprotein-quinone oxidoreductase
MNEEFDVIVVGAGFGGPVAAKICAEAGLKTLLIERAEKPGEKVISGLTIPFYGFLFGPRFIRDGNPPIERPADGIINYIIKDIKTSDIEVDDSLKVPPPFSPIVAFGYNTYCQPFCEWEADQAVKSGVKLLTSTTVVKLIIKNDYIKGVITDRGDKFYSKILIDAEGSQGLLAVKAGIRKKYPPHTISLADTYDYKMPKKLIDKIFGYSVRFCWGWDEQNIAPPLGYGNGLMVWPYRESLHFIQDQCLSLKNKQVPNLKRAFKMYHQNITSQLPWWKEKVAPNVSLRAKMFQSFEIYVGLNKNLREQPIFTNGMLLIGDAAGLESTELCDGVPSAWFSAEIAAKVAIDAIRKKNYSKSFLKRYDYAIRHHPIIQWSITSKNRYNLRYAQQSHDINMLRDYIHNGWGMGALTHFTAPLLKMIMKTLNYDKNIFSKWMKMYFRYFQNYLYNSYGNKIPDFRYKSISKHKKYQGFMFRLMLRIVDAMTSIFKMIIKIFKGSLIPSIESINPLIRKILPKIEPIYFGILKLLEPLSIKISNKLINFVLYADSNLFKTNQIEDIKNG